MTRAIVIYSLAVAAGVFLLQWLEYQYAVRLFSTEIYILIIAIGFTTLGIWVGHRLTRKPGNVAFERNERAIRELGITPSESSVLELLAEGLSNKEIAARLHVSTNTVKSHVHNVLSKLRASRRMQAVQKARTLGIVE